MTATTLVLRGTQVLPYLHDVARLRSRVFAAWPYLYEGNPGYEGGYLRAYAESPDSVFVLACADGQVVGAATGLPLADDGTEFRLPFEQAGRDPDAVFYFGESVLLPEWRGQGLGHAFFDAREAHARSLRRFSSTAFCAVDRDPADPRRPAGHRDNDVFWHKRGYTRQPGLSVQLRWQELDVGPVEHQLTFWTRELEPAA